MKNLLCFCFLSMICLTAHTQGWERLYYTNNGLVDYYRIAPCSDGGFILTADRNATVLEPHRITKLSATGEIQWTQDQQDVLGLKIPNILPVESGNLLFGAETGAQTKLVKTTGALNIIWSTAFPSTGSCSGCTPRLKNTPGGGYIAATQAGVDFAPIKVTRLDTAGTVLWQKTFDFNTMGTEFRFLLDIAADNAGSVYISGVQDFPYAPVLAKLSPAGDLLFIKTYPQGELIYGFGGLEVLNNQQLIGICANNTAILNSEGTVLSYFPGSFGVVRAAADGNMFIAYNNSGDMVLQKRTATGTVIWGKTFDLPLNIEGGNFWPLPDGGLVGVGRVFTGGNYEPFVVRTDSNGVTYTNQILGQVFADLDDDCQYTSGTDLLDRFRIIQAEKDGQYWYASTDSSGFYRFTLDSGLYLMRLTPPNDLWTACADSFPVTLSGTFDTVLLDLGLTSDFECPWPVVDIGAPFLRRCFPSTYTIEYANHGNVQADSATALLVLDPWLEFQSATLPHNDLGNNVYSFYLGNLGPLEEGSFQVTVLVDCDSTVLGQTHCSSVTIDIANPCPTTTIEQPVIRVEAECAGDSVQFTIQNIGGAPMPQPAEFIVIEDLIVMRQENFQLSAQQSTQVKCPSDGSTFRMYAGHAPGNLPFFSATDAIEGCNGPIVPGFWSMFPETLEPWSDRDCQPNIGAYDPNDKLATPTGYGAEHYIAFGVDLDYKIRFQNTGTDTAFTVVVRDTLSPFLDPRTIRIGPASHAFTWKLLGQGVLEFRFDNIRLPDSSTNLEASQGYLSFRISQQPGLPALTLIENRAAIYFDFNAPVITNQTWHRIGRAFLIMDTWWPRTPEFQLHVFPNPAAEWATVALDSPNPPSGTLDWTLADASGRPVLRQTTDSAQWGIRTGGLPAGVYWLQVRMGGRLLGVGKMVVLPH